jgi:hypothetical protein
MELKVFKPLRLPLRLLLGIHAMELKDGIERTERRGSESVQWS